MQQVNKFCESFVPASLMEGTILLDLERGAYDRAGLTQFIQMAQPDGLHQGIANCRGFHRAGDYRSLRSIRRELIEQAILDPATNNVDRGELLGGEFFESFQYPAVFQRDTFQRHTDDFAFSGWHNLVGICTILPDSFWHITRMKEPAVIWINYSQEGSRFRSEPRDIVIRQVIALVSPGTPAFLHEPKAHNILG